MLGCFIGILIMGVAKMGINKNDDGNDFEFFLGLGFMIYTANAYSATGVFTRKMKSLHFSIIQFYYGLFSIIALSSYLLIEFAVSPSYGYTSPRIFNYSSSKQWEVLGATGALNVMTQFLFTLAFQKEQAAFITLVSQLGVVYAFLGDRLVLKLPFELLQFCDAITIFVFNLIAVILMFKE